MPIEYISGDLFANRYHAQAFAHGCNCQGAMGAGIAVSFRERYPTMYEEYRRRCKAEPRQFNLGDVFLWRNEQQPWVFNLGTQERYWRGRASYEAIMAGCRGRRYALSLSASLPIGMGCCMCMQSSCLSRGDKQCHNRTLLNRRHSIWLTNCPG
jgi:O-acetyl-ADP-ribose deacetylase (regulator of RNase III)